MTNRIASVLAVFLAFATVSQAELVPYQIASGVPRTERFNYGLMQVGNAASACGDPCKIDGAVPIVFETPETPETLGPEGFRLRIDKTGAKVIAEGPSGFLYGCLELSNRIREQRGLPRDLDLTERPALKLRGTCIGMQKPYLLPGRKIYEFPYTEELFPFFYDKAFWIEYLDFLAERRLNLLSLWNGCPFGSLVRVEDYPYAVEVSDEQFERNVEMFRFIAEEADKRGIWVTQMFYSILLPKPFAERHGLDTQLSAPTPVAADYTRKAVAEFIAQYPNVGLHVCLGEAMLDVDHQRAWFEEVILPGVKDGMRRAGLSEEPPVMIRAHATDPSVVIPAGLRVYKNLYTEHKYNGESLTTWRPRGRAAESHRALSELASTHVVNVHILANLEPFRYGAQRFIKRSALAARDRLGAGGLHVYPLAYWNWPHSADATERPLWQTDRDWMWFDAWARYAWNADVDDATDRAYWLGRLGHFYGVDEENASRILQSCNDAGECAPRLIRRLGITEGNRQTLSLGMTLDQLVNPAKYNAWPDLWESQAPPGERLQEYVEREWAGQPHHGETPFTAIEEALGFAQSACDAIDAAAPAVTANREEFERLRNDFRCIQAMTRHYAAKVEAARLVLRHRLSEDRSDLQAAAERLAESLEHYRELVRLTDDTYEFANSLQIGHRRIPVRGVSEGEPAYFHWRQMEPLFADELAEFRESLGRDAGGADNAIAFEAVDFNAIAGADAAYEITDGAAPFKGDASTMTDIAAALRGLRGVRTPYGPAEGDDIVVEVAGPATLLVGYFRTTEAGWRAPPNPDLDATAHERGLAAALLTDAVAIDGAPQVDVYPLPLERGANRVRPPGSGRYLILGVVGSRPTRSAGDQ